MNVFNTNNCSKKHSFKKDSLLPSDQISSEVKYHMIFEILTQYFLSVDNTQHTCKNQFLSYEPFCQFVIIKLFSWPWTPWWMSGKCRYISINMIPLHTPTPKLHLHCCIRMNSFRAIVFADTMAWMQTPPKTSLLGEGNDFFFCITMMRLTSKSRTPGIG